MKILRKFKKLNKKLNLKNGDKKYRIKDNKKLISDKSNKGYIENNLKVTCAQCHKAKRANDDIDILYAVDTKLFDKRKNELAIGEYFTRCRVCGKTIILDKKQAYLNNLYMNLKNLDIKCELIATNDNKISSIKVYQKKGNYLLITYDTYASDMWNMQHYNSEDLRYGEDVIYKHSNKLLNYITKNKTIKRIEALQFV